jgi:hypothetical protein
MLMKLHCTVPVPFHLVPEVFPASASQQEREPGVVPRGVLASPLGRLPDSFNRSIGLLVHLMEGSRMSNFPCRGCRSAVSGREQFSCLTLPICPNSILQHPIDDSTAQTARPQRSRPTAGSHRRPELPPGPHAVKQISAGAQFGPLAARFL